MENLNVLDITRNKVFLEKLYPRGIFNYFIGQVSLDLSSSISITIHVKDKPDIEIPKWGKWGVNYNIITMELSANLAHHIDIKNWEKNIYSNCESEITRVMAENEEITSIKFFSKDWYIDLKTSFGLLYQKSNVYILDERDC